MAVAVRDGPMSGSPSPASKTEINLLRLLRCCEAQVASTSEQELQQDPKFHTYVAVLQEQLASLLGQGPQTGLPSISNAAATKYKERISRLASNLDTTALPDVWEPLRGHEEVPAGPESPPSASASASASTSYAPEQPSLAATLRRRAGHRGAATATAKGPGGASREGLKLDDASRQVIEKNRLLQEELTDQMVELAGRLKAHTLLIDSAAQESNQILSKQEVVVEHNIASTRQANSRATAIYKKSFCTGCFTWVVVFVLFWAFMGMVVLIRVT